MTFALKRTANSGRTQLIDPDKTALPCFLSRAKRMARLYLGLIRLEFDSGAVKIGVKRTHPKADLLVNAQPRF